MTPGAATRKAPVRTAASCATPRRRTTMSTSSPAASAVKAPAPTGGREPRIRRRAIPNAKELYGFQKPPWEAVKRGGLSAHLATRRARPAGTQPKNRYIPSRPLIEKGKTMIASYAKKLGRPVDPDSEASQKPWEKLGMSRASFYWKKRYGDLPKNAHPGYRPRARKTWTAAELENTPWRTILKKAQKARPRKASSRTAAQELAALRSLL